MQDNKKNEIVGDILVKQGNIFYIGEKYEGDTYGVKVIDGDEYIILPGFINTHIHLGESIFMDSFFEKYTLSEYLERVDLIYNKNRDIEKKRKKIVDYSALLALQSGTTTIGGPRVDGGSQSLGMRAVSGYMLMKTKKLGGFLNNFKRKYNSFCRSLGGLNSGCLFIHSLNFIDSNILQEIKSNFGNETIMIHIAETKEQENDIKNTFGKSSIEVLDEFGLLSKKTILIHCNYISHRDIEIIKKRNAKIVHCLASNMRVSDGVLDLKHCINNGVDVAIATDGLITSGGLDILKEAKLNYLFHNRFSNNILSAQNILDMITIKAAKVLGKDFEIGSIETGKKADLLFFKGIGKDNFVEKIVLYDSQISGVMINGEMIMWEGCLLSKNKAEIIDNFNSLLKSIDV